MLSKVFISHLDEEVALATVLKNWIETAFLGQVEVFVSSHDITAGEQWFARLEDELSDAKVMLVLCSAASVSMPWINFETGACHLKGIPVIPICHSGMDVESLPVPLSFFQSLNSGDQHFPQELMKDLAKHLGYSSAPRLPYEEFAADLRQTLTNPDDEMGFFDHQVKFTEHMSQLTQLMTTMGEETKLLGVETTSFTDRAVVSGANNDPRANQRIARSYGKKLEAYASKLMNLNRDFAELLPGVEASGQYVIQFQTPQSDDDWDAVENLLSIAVAAENQLSELSTSVTVARDTTEQIPNLQRKIRQASRKTATELHMLAQNLDRLVGMLRKIRATLDSLMNQRSIATN